jgi:hypothetical protein
MIDRVCGKARGVLRGHSGIGREFDALFERYRTILK